MDEKIKVKFTVPETLVESANRFLKSLAYPTQKPDGELSPPIPISVARESGGELGGYLVESLIFRPTGGVDSAGDPRAMAVEVLALPIKNKFVYTGPRGEGDLFICPECKAEHSRGPLDPLSQVYRCLKCGYTGPKEKVEDVRVPCPKCDTSGVETKGDVNSEPCSVCKGEGFVKKGDIEFVGIATSTVGSVGKAEKGPVDTVVTVENEDEFKGEFGDGKTFSSDEGKQKLKRRILDRMTAVDMVDAISNGCDLPNLADIIIDLYPEEEILDMMPGNEIVCAECDGTGTRLLDSNVQPCPKCNGRGLERPDAPDGPNPPKPCPTCNGTGADDGHVDDGAPNPPPCQTCWGSGTDAPAKDRPCPDCNGPGPVPEEE